MRSSVGNGFSGKASRRGVLGEDRAHGAGTVLRAQPVGASALTPGRRLCVQIIEIPEGARGEERFAHEADGALDPPLLISARHRHRAGLEAVVGGQLQ